MMNDIRVNYSAPGRLLQYLSIGVALVACKKPPEVAAPVPVVVETVSEVVDEPMEQEEPNSSTEGETEESEQSDVSEESDNAEVEFADNVNNAVALLTGDDESVQLGLQALQALQKNNETSPEVPYNIGVAQLRLENERAAQKSFEQAIEIDPTFSKAWFNLGVMLERQRQYEAAMSIYEEGLTHSETDPDLSAGKISCLRKMGRLDDSIVYAQEVLRKNANNVAAYSEVGAVYLEQGNLDKALFVLQQAAARNGSENAKLQSILGQVYYAQEKLPLAEQAFRKSLELDPTLIETAMYLSFLQLQNRAWSEANSTLEAALKYDPSNAALLNAHGVAKRGLGEIEEAERLYKEAYQLNPSNPEPLLNLAVLEADYRNEYTKAFELLDRYQNEGGQDIAVVDTWRSEFKESEAAYLKEKKQQELRDLFRRRREEAAKKRAEEEAKRAAEEAEEAEVGEAVEEDGTQDEAGANDDEETTSDDAGEQGAENDSSEAVNEDDEDEVSDDTDASTDESGNTSEEESDTEEGAESDDGNGWGAPIDDTPEESAEEVDDTDDVESSEAAEDDELTPDGDDSVVNEEVSPSVEADETVEPTEGAEAVEESTGSQDTGVDENSAGGEADIGWGAPATTETCTVQTDCTDEKVCSAAGECLYPGEFGTTLQGEECSTTEQCAVSLTCIESVCSQEDTSQDDTE